MTELCKTGKGKKRMSFGEGLNNVDMEYTPLLQGSVLWQGV